MITSIQQELELELELEMELELELILEPEKLLPITAQRQRQ